MAICTSLRRLPAARAVILAATFTALGQVDHAQTGTAKRMYATHGTPQTVWISALDRRGRPVANLKKDDLKLYEDDTERSIQAFGRKDADRLTVGLLVDASMKHRLPFFRPRLSGSSKLLDPILKDGGSVVMAAFGDHLSAALPTSDPGQIEESIQRAANVWLGRKTALFDAIGALCPSKFPEGRKALVIVSDADDTSSKISLADAVQTIKLTRTQVFFLTAVPEAIERFFDHQPWMMNARDVALHLASASGGKAYRVHTEAEVDSAFEEIAEYFASEYAVSFYSAGPGSHSIKVRSMRRGVKIVSQQDYPAPQN